MYTFYHEYLMGNRKKKWEILPKKYAVDLNGFTAKSKYNDCKECFLFYY